MGTAIFDKESGKMVVWSMWDDIAFDEETQVSGTFDEEPEFSSDTHFYNPATGNIEPLSEDEVIKRTYKKNRELAYPSIGDQLDAIWKCIANNGNLTAEGTDILNEIIQVKNDYPKGT